MKIAHIGDVHWRGLKRHEEYRHVFNKIFQEWKELGIDRIVVAGDIVHTKTQGITPELIDNLRWWFNSMAEIAPTIVTLGNHDGLIQNKSRLDSITPVIKALNNDRIIYIRDSEIVLDKELPIAWCNFSCFDEEGWEKVKPADDRINIAIYHGSVRGSYTDSNWALENFEVTESLFHNFDFAILGDIHKHQYIGSEKRIAYCGSTIQQNYGESLDKGYLIWNIQDKNTYSSKHYVVENPFPFITITWSNDLLSTIESCKFYPKGSRFRISSQHSLSQGEMQGLGEFLKDEMKASEITWKIEETSQASVIDLYDTELHKTSLSNHKTHLELFKKFVNDGSSFSDDDWIEIEKIIEHNVNLANENNLSREQLWSIKKMEWSNTFAYGRDNVINFENTNGIVGLFGPNRCGKSSIPGTIMYGLFNTTDRGPIKNLHIVNARKGEASVTIDFSVNSILYRAERMTNKVTNKKMETNAVTYMNLYRIDDEGNILEDLSGEQRRDSDKHLKELIGTPDDFLLTSFASQGEMNNFIRERATNRKSYLNAFLNLNIFDKVHQKLKEESSLMKDMIKVQRIDYDDEISKRERQLSQSEDLKSRLTCELGSMRQSLTDLMVSLATKKSHGSITQSDVDEVEKEISSLKKKVEEANLHIDDSLEKKSQAIEKIQKIENIKSRFPIDNLKDEKKEFFSLKETKSKFDSRLNREMVIFENQEKSIKKLNDVPCGDMYPTCMFIKDSHRDKALIQSQKLTIENLTEEIRIIKSQIKAIEEKNIDDKIQKYEKMLSEESSYRQAILSSQREIDLLTEAIKSNRERISHLEKELPSMRMNVINSEEAKEIDKIKISIRKLENEISQKEQEVFQIERKTGSVNEQIEKLMIDKDIYEKTKHKWRMYDQLLTAYGKNGIPLMVLSSELPKINAELAKILREVAGFTIELESPDNSNSLDIIINYGDSRRPIELGSGMEKMMASLAIRVALINISSLPKSDMLIIDEGFGALDENNIEACNRLLSSLKRYFKTILVISHVDAVKDAVDFMIEINNNGKDSYVRFE